MPLFIFITARPLFCFTEFRKEQADVRDNGHKTESRKKVRIQPKRKQRNYQLRIMFIASDFNNYQELDYLRYSNQT